MIAGSSFGWPGGISTDIGCPRISSFLYPYIFSAPLFQLTMVPSRLFPMMASLEASTIAVRSSPSARFRTRLRLFSSVHTAPNEYDSVGLLEVQNRGLQGHQLY